MNEEQGYINFITSEILDDVRLDDSAKLLFVRITGLAKKSGYCYASDEYFANKMSKNERTIQRYMKQLAEYGYIQRIINYYPNSKKIKSRHININRPLFNTDTDVNIDMDVDTNTDKFVDTNIDKNVRDNNKSMNNVLFTEVNNREKQKNKKFTIPSIEEIAAYCKERNNTVNAEAFHNFYSSKGWYVGKNKMKDWKAAVRTWEQKERPNNKIAYIPNTGEDTDFYRRISS